MRMIFCKIEILFILSFISICHTHAQNLLTNNHSLIYLSNESYLKVNGSILISGNQSLENNGLISMTGNVNFVLSDSSQNLGHFKFADSSVQSISSNFLLNFEFITIDKDNSVVFLNSNIALSNFIFLNKGIVDIQNQNIYLLENGSLTIENDSAYITGNNGFIEKTGNIPANESINLGNIGLEIESSNNLGETLIRRTHNPKEIGGANGIKRAFDIIPEFNSSLDATLTLYYINNETERSNIPKQAINTYVYNNNEWKQALAFQDTANNRIILENVNSFRPTTGALGNFLPVEFIDFTATNVNNEKVKLNWSTATEINNDFFTIERSSNGLDFEPIGSVSGAGNSVFQINYEYFDNEPLEGVSYYRIKQTDFNGQFEYSIIRSVTINIKGNLLVYPNPSSNGVLNISGIIGENEIKIYDSLGKLLLYNILNSSKLNSIHSINTSNFTTGAYFLKINDSNGNSFFTKVLIL